MAKAIIELNDRDVEAVFTVDKDRNLEGVQSARYVDTGRPVNFHRIDDVREEIQELIDTCYQDIELDPYEDLSSLHVDPKTGLAKFDD